jgi:hypothetical protein
LGDSVADSHGVASAATAWRGYHDTSESQIK